MKSVVIEKSKDDYLIAKVKINDKFKYIGSKYNTKSYIDKFVESINDVSKDTIFIILGLGAGEHIKEIKKRYPNSAIFIFEPNDDLYEYYKNGEEFKWIRENKDIAVNKYSEEIFITVTKFNISDESISKIKTYICYGYENLYKEVCLEFLEKSKKIMIEKVIGINTRLLFAKTWFEHFLNNIDPMSNSITANNFIGKLKNKPAIIVSAGPSLDGNIKYIKELDDEMFIFCGGRNLKAFDKEKIVPHLVSIIDPGEISYKIVEGYIEKCKSPLLFYEGSNSKVVNAHKGQKVLYTQSDVVKNVFNEKILDLGVGGSVAHVITKFAAEAGCNPIIFIGQDLAFSNNKMHAESAKMDGAKFDINKHHKIEVVQYGGKGTVQTDSSLDMFRNQIEKIINDYPHIKFINSSVGGARINGTIEMNLEDAIKQYKTKVEKLSFDLSETKKLEVKQKFDLLIQRSISDIKELIKISKVGLVKSSDLKKAYITNDLSKYDKVSSDINNIDREVSDIYNRNAIFKNILYPIILWGNNQEYNNVNDYKSKMEYINEVKEKKDLLYNKLTESGSEILEQLENI